MNQNKKVNSINDQNRRQLQQKFQKYKASKLQVFKDQNTTQTILSEIPHNTCIIPNKNQIIQQRQISIQLIDNVNFAKLLKIMPKNQKILQVMLTDPCVNQLSQCLKKQAEQKNMHTLVSTFPQRYQNLLQTQIKYKNLQKSTKQKINTLNKQIQFLMQKLIKMEQQHKQQSKIIQNTQSTLRINLQHKYTQLSQQIKKKQLTIIQFKDQLQKLNKKTNKYKQDYKNSSNLVQQLRQQQQNMTKQNNRLVDKLKQNQQKLTKCHKKLLQFNNQKKLQINSIVQQYQDKIKQIKQQKIHIQQLLQQANMRVQYKQSLLSMSQKENQENIHKLEQENVKRYEQLQKLREQHLDALKTIDELQQRVNRQQQQIVRQAQIWVLQKQQLKKQLEKAHQWNGQLKAEVDYKSQLIKTLQKSIQHLKISFQSDLLTKTNQWMQQNRQLLQSKSQINTLKNIHGQYEKTLKKYLQKIIEQQQTCCELQLKIQKWIKDKQNQHVYDDEDDFDKKIKCHNRIKSNGNIKKNYHVISTNNKQLQISTAEQVTQQIPQSNYLRNTKQNYHSDDTQQYKNKIRQYELIIDKLKKQMINLTNYNRENAEKSSKIMKDLINQNKMLKKKLQLQEQPSLKINLFGPNK